MIGLQETLAGRVIPGAIALPTKAKAIEATYPSSEAVSIQGLSKAYGKVTAISDLSFDIRRGEVFALLGRNGAGKTTTIEILEGYRKRDTGAVSVLGLDPGARSDMEKLRQRIGVMLQLTTIYQAAKVGEVINTFASYYKNPADTGELLALVGMDNFTRHYFKDLSGGQKQRVSLALALVGKPAIVFLDEPTAAMDPQSRHQTWEIIQSLKSRGVTVLLTTHYLEEAQRLADRVAIIDKGTLAALDTPSGLTHRFGGDTICFNCRPGLPIEELAALDGAKSATQVAPDEYRVVAYDADTLTVALVLWAQAAGLRLSGIKIERASLEDVFLKLTGEEVRN
jgi:ABC-2 type transport system ATP-binding protein